MEPSDWKETEFQELLVDRSISYGVVQPGSHTEQNCVPIIRVNNIRNGVIETNDVMKISAEIESKYRRTRLEGGELLITVVGSVGECAIVPDSLKGWNVARAVSVARISRSADVRFVRYSFRSEDIIFQMYGGTNDTVQPTLNLSSLKTLKLKMPSLPEQRAIAAVLSSLDNKIDLLHRQNKTLEAMAETLFRQWFVEEASDDWEEGNLPDEFVFTMGQSPSGDTFNETGEGLPMYQGNADFGFRFPTRRIYTTTPSRMAQALDTLISVRAPVGAQNMASEICCIGRGVAAFRYKSAEGYHAYTYYKLRSMMSDFKQFNAEGTVFGSIGKNDIQQLKVKVPPTDLVEKFHNEASALDHKVIANCEQVGTLEKLRDALLPKLMSGEVSVQYE